MTEKENALPFVTKQRSTSSKEKKSHMDTVKHLQKARAKKAENLRRGIKPQNPIEKAKQNPKSRVLAIAAFCFECMGREEKGWRNDVRNCPSTECPLYGLRPYKK